MARRYHLDPLPTAGRQPLPRAVAHHLARVMRADVGDPIRLFDGRGVECDARIVAIAGSGSKLEVTVEVAAAAQRSETTREPGVRVAVAFPSPKGNREDWIFEHGTEVGVASFHPIHTARSVRTAGGRLTRRLERWHRILVAATGQCDRARIPELREPVDLEVLLDDPGLPAERYFADRAAPPLGPARTGAALLLVGPEGGLTDDELDRARAAGFRARSLGVTTLRTETAVLAGAVRLLAHDHGTG